MVEAGTASQPFLFKSSRKKRGLLQIVKDKALGFALLSLIGCLKSHAHA